jgi:hypothetical protein
MLPSIPNPINLAINQLIGYLILNIINARKLGDSFHYSFHSFNWKCIFPGSTTVKNPMYAPYATLVNLSPRIFLDMYGLILYLEILLVLSVLE